MFKITAEKFGDFTKLKLSNTATGEYVSIIPDHGANINEIILRKGKSLFSVIEGDRTPQELRRNEKYRGAKLTPFPNRIKDGRYFLGKKEYALPINFPSQGHAIHGLVYDKKFDITKKSVTRTGAQVIMEYTADGSQGYPFKFSVAITFKLGAKGFLCKTTIKNKDDRRIPIGDGWHPYFTLSCKVDALSFKIPARKSIAVDGRMIPTGKTQAFKAFQKPTKIGDHYFDTGFAVSGKSMAVTEIIGEQAAIQIWQETGVRKYNYVQIYIPPARTSIAVEPMTCIADVFNNKVGLITLRPKEKFSAAFGVRLR